MGWQSVSKWLIIGLIIGLVAGFSGGYYYKNLNAEAPVTNTSKQVDTLASAQLQQAVNGSITEAVEKYGFKSVFGGDKPVSSSDTVKQGTLARLGIIKTAEAQTKGCAGSQVGLITDILKQYLNNIHKGAEEVPCVKSISIDGTLSFSLYGAPDKDDPNGPVVYSKIEWTFSGVQTLVVTRPDKNCQDETTRLIVESGDTLYWDGTTVSKDEPIGSTGQWYLICEDQTHFTWTWLNPSYSREKCCGKTLPVPTKAGAAQ